MQCPRKTLTGDHWLGAPFYVQRFPNPALEQMIQATPGSNI
jgi:hypothetical protein